VRFRGIFRAVDAAWSDVPHETAFAALRARCAAAWRAHAALAPLPGAFLQRIGATLGCAHACDATLP
jgi:hypothetical protein